MNYKKFIKKAAYAVTIAGLLVIAGWFFNIPILKTMFPGYISMKIDTAICFVLAGIALRQIQSKEQSILSTVLILMVTFIAMLSMSQDIFKIERGIDNILITDHQLPSNENLHPGRMALPIAVCFLLLSAGLFCMRKESFRTIGQTLFNLIIIIAFIAITGYLLEVPALYKLSIFASIPVHTALLLLIISIAGVLMYPSIGLCGLFTGKEPGNLMAKNLFPRMVVALMILTVLRIAAHRYHLVDTEFGIALFAMSFLLVGLFLIWNAASALNVNDEQRTRAEEEQIFVNQNLEKIVHQRTRQLEDAFAQLQNKGELNQIFISQAPNAIAMFDRDMRYLAASQKWSEDYGLKGKTIIGKSHYDIFPEIGDDWKIIHKMCLQGEVNQCSEAEFTRSDGSIQWITWDVRPWYVNKDEIGGIIMYTSDITDITLKDLEKRRVEDILDRTSEVARIGTWEIDLKTNTLLWSKMTREIHELPEDYQPQLESAINFFKAGRSRELIQQAVEEAIRFGKSYDLELELLTATGKIVWARAIGQAEFYKGNCKRLYGVFQDIDEVKRSRETLAKLNGELQAIFSSAYVSIIGTDLNGTITSFNRGAEILLKYDAEELVGKHTPALIHLKDEVIERGMELSEQFNRKIEGFEVFVEIPKSNGFEAKEWTYVRKDGSMFPVQLVVTAIRDIAGNAMGFLGIATDISDLMEARTNLQVLTEKLQQQNKQLLSFAHITSHNLRSPVSNLNTVIFLHKEALDEEDKNVLWGHIETVVGHLTETLNQLVDSLRVQEDKGKERENLKFSDAFIKTKEIFIGTILETHAEIEANFSAVDDIEYPATYLESIFLNLLSNALKYRSPNRHPKISIVSSLTQNGLILKVTDNGLGIDLKRHGEKIFGLNKTFHRHPDAKGVGLFMTKTQIEAMGGKIAVESEPDKGTTFTIFFNADLNP